MTSTFRRLRNASPVSLTSSWRANSPFGAPLRSDAVAALSTMGSVGTLFAIVNRTAEALSMVQWKLYRKGTDARRTFAHSGMDDRREVTQHLALKVWNKPNPFMTQQEFIEIFSQHLDLVGESWWVVGRDPRATFPMELWPVRPDRMRPLEHPTEYISGYQYFTPDGSWMDLKTDEAIFLRRPNPADAYRGIGPVQALMADIDANRYGKEWNRNFFSNSAEPGGIIETDTRLSDSQFNELRDRWNEGHKGVANAHRVAILEGHKWVSNSFTQRDMQFAELATLSAEMIREGFAFPKPMLGTVENANRAAYEAALVQFADWLLVPRLARIKAALNNDFLPLFGTTGQGVEFDYVSPSPGDAEAENAEITTKANAWSSVVDSGADPAAASEWLGIPDLGYTAPAPAPRTAIPTARLEIEDALRWVVRANHDDNTCEPCLSNDGKLYRNRADAYADYPGGSNYVHCVGEKYGNECRCRVVKRGKE